MNWKNIYNWFINSFIFPSKSSGKNVSSFYIFLWQSEKRKVLFIKQYDSNKGEVKKNE